MKPSYRTAFFVAVAALVLCLAWKLSAAPDKEPPAASAAPHYTVVETDGAHLIVTDNQANKVYFYTIDQNGKIGDDLKLRGYGDLNEVGKPTIKPNVVK